jgi:ABC-2 type transport system ATP-binding protein
MSVILSVRDLKKTFGRCSSPKEGGDPGKAVARGADGVSFDLLRGEAFGLLGPNGAGKTTTISLIMGILKPDSGEVSINGKPPTELETRRKLGLAPQALSLYQDLTARENLEFFGKLYSPSRQWLRDRVDWALAFAGLSDRGNDLVKNCSGGMKRRLNLACALIHEPEVIFLDEPTVGVDPQSRNHLFECIEQLKRDGITILYTTHYMEEAERLCDRVAIMDHGRLLAMDHVDALLNRHGGKSLVTGTLSRIPEDIDRVMKELPGDLDDLAWRYQGEDPMRAITIAARCGADFHSLAIQRPDLESVFLNLTGRSLRD